MLHPAKARVTSPAAAARDARRELARMASTSSSYDASRYFRGADDLAFLNVGTQPVRTMAKAIVAVHREDWTVADAATFADLLIRDRHLEVKAVGIEALACYRRQFSRALLPMWKRWLAENHSANWATTDAICGLLIGPLLAAQPRLADGVARWATNRNMWVRRASIVSLIPLARHGKALDLVYAAARTLHRDDEDLIHKAVGWALREAGKTDMERLERYLLANGPKIPRTAVRYAIERFQPSTRRRLLLATR
jgi:3-methyladenine DNA glycosylase AlkD